MANRQDPWAGETVFVFAFLNLGDCIPEIFSFLKVARGERASSSPSKKEREYVRTRSVAALRSVFYFRSRPDHNNNNLTHSDEDGSQIRTTERESRGGTTARACLKVRSYSSRFLDVRCRSDRIPSSQLVFFL